MIVKRNFNPIKVWGYIKFPASVSIFWSVLVWFIYSQSNFKLPSINFSLVGVLGSALAIFIAFRNNSSYSRWWEARSIWSGILSSTRILARLIITFADSHSHQQNYDSERSNKFKSEMINKIIAWVHLLRYELRQQNEYQNLKAYLNEEEFSELTKIQNKPNYLMLLLGKRIYKAMADGTLGGFDSFQMEGQLLALSNFQASSERIKNTPLPRQYDFFTRVFVHIFIFILPFGLINFFTIDNSVSAYLIPVSIIIASVFIIMERTGAANENPFENLITDVPLTYICNTIERDLKEMLGEDSLPEKVKTVNGYLY